jgi:hypothetical protein
MRRMIAAAAVALLVGGVGGYVLHGQGGLRVLGSGTISCGKWVEYRPDNAEQEENWVNGYLTGRQEDGPGLTANQTGDLAGRNAWIDQYCQGHPIDSLLEASRALLRALRAK